MVWEKRQERLRAGIIGGNNLCLSVFVILDESNIRNREYFPPDEFGQLCDKHDINPLRGDNFNLPPLKLGKYSEHGGYIFHATDGAKLIEKKTLTPLYSISPYSMLDFHVDRGSASLDMYFIKSLYTPQIFEQFDNFDYIDEDDFFYENNDFNIKFGYVVQPYEPSICHPNDLGRLNNLIMPNGVVIHPPIEQLKSIDELKSSKLRNKSFSLYS